MNVRSTKLWLLSMATTVDSRKLLRSRNLIKDAMVSVDNDDFSQVELFNELSTSFVSASLALEETGEESIAIDSFDDLTTTVS